MPHQTFLEKVKGLYTNHPGLPPDKIAPTVGQNSMSTSYSAAFRLILTSCYITVGKITLPSTILQFFDLGGQSGIRSIWSRYYDDCHAVVYVLDAADHERLNEGWEVFGES